MVKRGCSVLHQIFVSKLKLPKRELRFGSVLEITGRQLHNRRYSLRF